MRITQRTSSLMFLIPLFVVGFLSTQAQAGLLGEGLKLKELRVPANSFLLAQEDADAYDPFADYNEFEEATEEEADINFFRNGRFLSVGLLGGYRRFTSILHELQGPAAYFGGFVTFFFDLRFAIQVAFVTGDHLFNLNDEYRGLITVQHTSFDVKYFLNSQNVTRGLAAFNPYLLVGLCNVSQTRRFDSITGYSKDSAWGAQGGVGFEIPLLKGKMFIGAEAVYQYVNFPDENIELSLPPSNNPTGTPVPTGIFPRGDIVRFSGILGINF
ncbi:MAG: hypothetical protein K2X47_19070 [Bdellovibrionales bacterium]|nr:hypothetical protein [Bdellovibrionales bacterium]